MKEEEKGRYFRDYMRKYQREKRFLELDTDSKIAYSRRHTSQEQFQAVCQDLYDAGYDPDEILGIVFGVWLDKTEKREPVKLGFTLRHTSEGMFLIFGKVEKDEGDIVDKELWISHKGPDSVLSEKYSFEMEEVK